MKAVIQRVLEASVTVNHNRISEIKEGLLILLSITDDDTNEDLTWLSHKIANLRIFNDAKGVMNHSLIDQKGEAIVVSQFTLHAATKKGHRPSYIKAAKPDYALPMYEQFVVQFEKDIKKQVQKGEFGADMKVHLINDGPVTIIIDTKDKK